MSAVKRSIEMEYETLAERCALRGVTTPFGTFYVSPPVRAQIECDPQEFARRVSDYAYGAAMERIDAKRVQP